MQLSSLLDKGYPQPHIWKHSGPDNQLELNQKSAMLEQINYDDL